MSLWKWIWNDSEDEYKGEITRDTEWEQLNGGQIQAWLKNELDSKYAVIRVSTDEENAYLQLFSTKEDEQLYDSDPELYKDRVKIITLPAMGGGQQGDSFSAMLSTNIPQNDIVVTKEDLIVGFNFRAIRFIKGVASNEGALGTLIVQKSTNNGSTWDNVGQLNNVLRSSNPEDSTTIQEVNLGQFLTLGKQLIRVRASYQYEDIQTGELKTMNSPWVNIGMSITKTELSLVLETPYQVPMFAKNEETGEYNRFVVNYRVMGATNKKLYVTVEGSVDSTTIIKDLSVDIDGTTEGISLGFDSSYGFHDHGVRKVTAYLEAEDGLGNTIKSNELRNQFMMVNPESEGYNASQKFLLLQNVKEEAVNYIQTSIAEYAVYASEDTEITFKVTSSKDVSYTEVIKTVKPNTANSIEMTVEIEPEDEGSIPEGYRTRFYVFNGNENFILSSGLNEFGYYDIYVDNSEAVVPVLGSTFLLNPKNRDNSEANPKRILNERANNNEVESVWENFGFINDGWMLDAEGNKVLRVMAGNKLTIKRNIFKQFLTNPDSSMTIDIDFKVSNVTDLENPIIAIDGGEGKGLILNSLKGWVKTASYNDNDNCMFAWREDKRQFLSLNIHNNVRPLGKECVYPNDKAAQAQGSLALARVLLNGDPVREIPFDKTTNDWCTTSDIVIGNDGADIDIYSIRIYENTQVDIKDLLNRNWISSLPTTAEKQAAKAYNNLLEGGRISLEKAKQRGLNCIVYHGDRPYAFNTAEPTGWIEYFRYNKDGEFMPEHSGKNCEETKALQWKAQGSTAKTYYEHNVQDDNSKVKATIEVPLDKFHSSIKVRIDGDKAYITGGNLGKNFPLESEEAEYPYSNGKVTVPDGWIDGNGMYRGMGYMVSPNTPLAQKKVSKINYASAMHSHLIAACNSYDDLHYLVCGASPLQQQYLDKGLTRPVSAKRTEPFLMFWEMNGVVYYTGLCIYGAGKMDKVSWGYVKKKHPMFAMIEGADNNLPLTDFRVPFDDTVTYDAKEEGWQYNGSQSFDFDAGATDDNDVPVNAIVKQWKAYHNFIYLNSPNIDYFDGTVDQFRLSTQAAQNLSTKYWCTEGSKAFHLLRYDYINEKWIDAGLKDLDGNYSIVNLKTDIRTKTTYEKYKTSSAYATINEAFRGDFGKFFKTNAKFLMSLDSLLFCYSYVLTFLAGTDNSSKNTYFKIDPIKQDMSSQVNSEFSEWWFNNFGEDFDFAECYLVYMDGDDMDSILPVNNKGNLTKPYYIERLYPYADDKPNECLYEGMQNQLFNLVELIYSDEERSIMMNRILTAAQSLVTTDDELLGLNDNKVSVWGFLHKYFFNVQYYFPKIAYLEQARIRYEFAELMGHLGARSVRPISQSIGSQVENEQQFMEQRLVYMASFAVFGALGNKSGAIGLADTVDEFAFQGCEASDGTPADFIFEVTPHQYIYPCGFDGQTTKPTYQRTSPKQTCNVTVAKGVVGNSDTSMGLRGVNYYSNLGKGLGGMRTTKPLVIKGKRITTIHFNDRTSIKAPSLSIDAPNCTYIAICSSHVDPIQVDLSKMIRAKTIQVTRNISSAIFPESHNFSSFIAYGSLTKFRINNAPNFKSLTMNQIGIEVHMNDFYVGKNVGTNTGFSFQNIVNRLYEAQVFGGYGQYLKSIHVENINWTDFDVNALAWLADRPTCELYGTIGIAEGTNEYQTAVTWDLKNKFNAKFGNVDLPKEQYGYKGLLLNYRKRDTLPNEAKIRGSFCAELGDTFKFEVVPSSIYENTHTKIVYGCSNINGTMDSSTGILTIKSLSNTKNIGKIYADIHRVNASGNAVTYIRIQKELEIWNRPAQVGDLVYADGSFGPAESYEGEKTVVGRCFYVAPRKADGTIDEIYHDPNDIMTRLMVACNDITASSTQETFNTWQWGACSIENDPQLDAEQALYSQEPQEDGTIKKVGLSIDNGMTTIYDIPTIQNIDFQGSYPFKEESTFRDYTTNANDNFVPYDAHVVLGNGFAYNENGVLKGNRTLRKTSQTLPFELLGDSYKEKADGINLVNIGYANTLGIIKHRNDIINHIENTGNINNIYLPMTKPEATNNKSELDILVELMSTLRSYAKSSDGLNDVYGEKWSQLYYPAASACYAYEPRNLMDGETLATKFKKHHWFLPTSGLIVRIWYYCYTYDSNQDSYVQRTESPLEDVYYKGKKIFSRPAPYDGFWSSSESMYRSYVYILGFSYGYLFSTYKGGNHNERPIAAF